MNSSDTPRVTANRRVPRAPNVPLVRRTTVLPDDSRSASVAAHDANALCLSQAWWNDDGLLNPSEGTPTETGVPKPIGGSSLEVAPRDRRCNECRNLNLISCQHPRRVGKSSLNMGIGRYTTRIIGDDPAPIQLPPDERCGQCRRFDFYGCDHGQSMEERMKYIEGLPPVPLPSDAHDIVGVPAGSVHSWFGSY